MGVPTGARLYLDANIFIYFLDRYPPMAAAVDRLFAAVATRAVGAVTGQLAVAEVMVGVYRRDEPATVQRAHSFFHASGLTSIVGHGSADFDNAARLRAALGLSLIDAIHIATAQGAGCTHLVTNDTRMPSVPGLQVVRLQDLEEIPG